MEYIVRLFMRSWIVLILLVVYLMSPNSSNSSVGSVPSNPYVGLWIIGGIFFFLFVVAKPLVAFFGKRQLSISYLAGLERFEEAIMIFVSRPEDTIETTNERYAEVIGVSKPGEKLPEYFQFLITYRILFAYLKRFGDLKPRAYSGFKFTPADAIAPLHDNEKEAFRNFCKIQYGEVPQHSDPASVPANTQQSVV